MNGQSTCALADQGTLWHSIDWDTARATVKRMQARIVKATQAGRWNRVKALQRLLTTSFYGKALAVKRVTENQGKRTPGVDKVLWSTPDEGRRLYRPSHPHCHARVLDLRALGRNGRSRRQSRLLH
ncbi:reverse transcriptase N-terminal domain-containing protein [Burkholderia cenocepacia]|uniref:reverse transcriptase N-terminal domain-containing protein n=1 Tax=Burkholderia cenocepacia TaxID=95486 RepID=UPI0009B2CA10|nr:reverse transcriptase N-terminal domain-containing protein [Burkholderia cenocepacia]